jgi:DnaK suppressor protein
MGANGTQTRAGTDPREVRSVLAAERERVIGMRHALEEEAADPSMNLTLADQHPADSGSDTFERSKLLAILDRADQHLSDIDRALERLERGEYGLCEACGEPIGSTRLRARPAARLCLRDQELAEQQEAAPASGTTRGPRS